MRKYFLTSSPVALHFHFSSKSQSDFAVGFQDLIRLQQSKHLTIRIPSSGGGRSYPVSPTSTPFREEVLAAWVTKRPRLVAI